jgi:hypothetical protein
VWLLSLAAIIGVAGTGLFVFWFTKDHPQYARETQAAVTAVQAVTALTVAAATVVLAQLTRKYVNETRRLANVALHQEIYRRRAQAADALAWCLGEIRWETTERANVDKLLTPKAVRNYCRTWQREWAKHRALIVDQAPGVKAQSFEDLTREARSSIGEDSARALEYGKRLGVESVRVIEALDALRSTLPAELI